MSTTHQKADFTNQHTDIDNYEWLVFDMVLLCACQPWARPLLRGHMFVPLEMVCRYSNGPRGEEAL